MFDQESPFEKVILGNQSSGSVREVDLLNRVNSFLEHYQSSFKGKYGVNPIRLKEDDEAARWAVIKLGDSAKDYVTAYFSVDGEGDWFKKQAHSLQCFKSSINKINVVYAKGKPREIHPFLKDELLICDSCWVRFIAAVPNKINYDTAWIRCPKCNDTNAPWKYPTEAEFKKGWANYPEEIPSYAKIFKLKCPYPPERICLEYKFVGYHKEETEKEFF